MRGKAMGAFLILLLTTVALAQGPAPATAAPQQRVWVQHRAGPAPGGMDMGMHFGNFMRPPMELLGQWWNNPEIANELRLTDAQKKQLEDASVKTRLALIDTAADGLKALTRLQAMLETDQINDAAYDQQVTALSTDAANAVKTIGQMVLTTRHVLTPDQWQKLQAFQHAHRRMGPPPIRPQPPMPPRPPAPPAGAPAPSPGQ